MLWVAALCLSPASVPGQANAPVSRWTLLRDGGVVIGQEGDPNKEFSRVFGAMRTSLGEIVVPDFGSAEIRVFSKEGAFQRKFGRRGAGPGEFRSLTLSGRIGDSMFIGDVGQSRVSVVHPVNGFIRQRSLAGLDVGRVEILGVMKNGAFVVHPLRNSGSGPQEHGVWRDSMQIGLVEPIEPLRVAWLRSFPGSSHLTINPRQEAKARAVGNYPYGPNIRLAVSDSVLLIGDTGSPELRVLDSRGRDIGRISLLLSPRKFDNARFDLAKKEAVAAINDTIARSQVAERYSLSHRPVFEPLFDRLIISRDGFIWVERFRYLRADPTEFLVFNSAGKQVANIVAPNRLIVYEIGTDYIVGVERDDDGVERVRLVHYARK